MKIYVAYLGLRDCYVSPYYFKTEQEAQTFVEDRGKDAYEDITEIDTENISFGE